MRVWQRACERGRERERASLTHTRADVDALSVQWSSVASPQNSCPRIPIK